MPNPIPGAEQPQLISELAMEFINNSRTAMGTLQNSINRVPNLRQRVIDLGGLRRVATENPLSAQTREVLPVLTSLENSLFLERFTEGDVNNIPSAQELAEGIGQSINIGTGIADHLAECCNDLRNRLIKLKSQLTRVRNEILEIIARKANSINRRIASLRADILYIYQDEKRKFLEGLEAAKEECKDLIKDIVNSELQPVFEKLDIINVKCDNLTSKLDEIEGMVNNRLNTIDQKVSQVIGDVAQVSEICVESRGAIAALTTEFDIYVATYGLDTVANKELITTSTGSVLAAVAGVEETIVTKIILDKGFVKTEISQSEKNLKENTKENFDSQNLFLKDTNKGFPYILTDQICCNVVGESYARWDSICSFYPTIVFVFNEVTGDEKPRRTQIKLRLNQPSTEITDKNVQNIIVKVRNLGEVSYQHGTCKGNYVSSDKRFRTTVWGEDRNNIELILTLLFTVVDEYFDPGLLSTTNIGVKRPSLTKRKQDLFHTGLNNANYNQTFTLKLKSANLLVNGLKTIIKLRD